jgi:hypothetical protein
MCFAPAMIRAFFRQEFHKRPGKRLNRLRKKCFILSFRAKRGISLRFNHKKTKKEGFLASLGMTEMVGFSAACEITLTSQGRKPQIA